MRRPPLATLIVCLAALSASPALAQSLPGGLASGAPKAPAPETKAAEPPPAAVPGARARAGTVVPADRATADLPPNEALFDAINRGDIASARDAISRGADLDATNLLGLTPTELSVDLARNDITFLLLSFRGGSGGGARGPQQQAVDAVAAAPTAADKRRAKQQARAQQEAAKAAIRQAATRTQSAPLFAGNGGTANPTVGFLGFNPTR